MNTPYTAPNPTSFEQQKVSQGMRFWRRMTWIAMVVIIIPPMIGVGGTVIGMIRAFNELGQTGKPDPKVLAQDISVSLLTTMYGLGISLLGIVLLAVSIIRRGVIRRRASDPA